MPAHGRVETNNEYQLLFLSYFHNIHSHSMLLHGITSASSPRQLAPPCAGAGFVQVLRLVNVPPRQLAEHPEPSDHADHAPFTKYGRYNKP